MPKRGYTDREKHGWKALVPGCILILNKIRDLLKEFSMDGIVIAFKKSPTLFAGQKSTNGILQELFL